MKFISNRIRQKPTRIVLVDDSEIVVNGLQHLLLSHEDLILSKVCRNPETALTFLCQQRIDIILIRLQAFENENLMVIEEIREKFPRLKIIVIILEVMDFPVNQLLKRGVKGFILPHDDTSKMVNTIRRVHKNDKYLLDEILKLEQANLKYTSDKKINNFLVNLTGREKEILLLLAMGFNSVEISRKLFISSHTVNTHRKHLIQKSGAKNSAALIRLSYESGILKDTTLQLRKETG